MKRLLLMMLLIGAATLCRAADSPTLKADGKPETEAQLLKLEREWNEVLKARDRAGLLRICADDFVFTDDGGKISRREKYITEATGNLKVSAYALHDLSVHSYGDTGVVCGRWTGTIASEGGPETETNVRFTDTFVRRDRRWWAVASQMTAVADR